MFQNLQALAELAKAGFKPSDIKELLELEGLNKAPDQNKAADDNGNKSPDKSEDKTEPQSEDPFEAIIKRNEEN